MNTNIQPSQSLIFNNLNSTFIHLKERTFAEYDIIYHINDGYSLSELSKVHSRHQLLFQKFKSKVQQLNLMLVDSLFPIHLADLALETLLNNIFSFDEYIKLKKDFVIIDNKSDKDYFTYKFKTFIHYLLYSNIATQKIWTGELMNDRVYYFQDEYSEIKYFSVLQLSDLLKIQLEKLKIEIDFNQSRILKREANIRLKIFIV